MECAQPDRCCDTTADNGDGCARCKAATGRWRGLRKQLRQWMCGRAGSRAQANEHRHREIADREGEEALRRLEEQHRSLVENLNDVVFTTDTEGNLTYVSPAIERWTEYRPEQMVGQSLSRFIHPDDLPRVLASFTHTLAGQLEPLEFRVFDKHGQVRRIRTSSRPRFEEAGQLVGMTGIITDVTERKRVEEALRDSEARVAGIISSVMDAIITVDDDQRIVLFNAAAEQMFRCPAADAIGGLLDRFIPERFRAGHGEKMRAFRRTGATDRRMGALPTLRGLRSDGEEFPMEASISRLEIAGQNFCTVVMRDITERKRAEEETALLLQIVQQEAEVSGALQQVGRELISSLDRPVLLDRLCQVTTEVLGSDVSHTFLWRPEENVYVPVAQHGDTPEQWESLRVLKIPRDMVAGLAAALARDDVVQVQMAAPRGLLPAALHMQYGITAGIYMALRRGGELIGIQAAGYRGRQEPSTPQQERIARGLAQIASLALQNARLVEELEYANRLKSDFMATMSHELRTPLNVIMGYNDLVLEGAFGGLAPEQAECLQHVARSARQLTELISATLDMGRLETGRLPVELRVIDLPDLLQEIDADTRQAREDKHGVRFAWQIAAELPPLHTDPVKLKVVLKNLISNALKFTDAGSITVSAHPHDGGVAIAVADTGIGIAPESLGVIFEPFRQLESSLTRRFGGVGLGLYAVRRLLEVLGGTVTVESELGRGSTFRVWLPSDAQPGGANAVPKSE